MHTILINSHISGKLPYTVQHSYTETNAEKNWKIVLSNQERKITCLSIFNISKIIYICISENVYEYDVFVYFYSLF